MSIVFQSNDYKLLDHRDFTLKLFKEVPVTIEETASFALTAKLFSVVSCKRKPTRKRCHNYAEETEEVSLIKGMLERFSQELPEKIKTIFQKYKQAEIGAVRSLSRQLFESTIFDFGIMNGGNNSEKTLQCKIKGEYFFIPYKSRFFCGDVKEQCLKLTGEKFQILIADPPWWNKYIRRLKKANEKLSYSMMYNEDIAAIPVKDLLAPNSVIAVWCTNSPSNIAAVKDIIFPSWGVEYLTTWYWLKVTVEFEPLYEFSTGSKKQPYERLMLGKVGNVTVPETQLLISVPSALHSHKPPIINLLSPFVAAENPRTLELFARYLLPNTTSLGYEPLKWQHISLYEKIS